MMPAFPTPVAAIVALLVAYWIGVVAYAIRRGIRRRHPEEAALVPTLSASTKIFSNAGGWPGRVAVYPGFVVIGVIDGLFLLRRKDVKGIYTSGSKLTGKCIRIHCNGRELPHRFVLVEPHGSGLDVALRGCLLEYTSHHGGGGEGHR